MLGRVLEEDMASGRDEYPEVPRAALVFVLHEYAGGIHAEIRLCAGISAHHLDEGLGQVGERAVPAAHRRACELETFARVDVLEPMKW
jgi:hypothetical protein